MSYVILALLAIVLAEAAVLAGKEIWDTFRPVSGGGEPAEEADYEKKWQESVSAVMGYDLRAARKAAGNDGENER